MSKPIDASSDSELCSLIQQAQNGDQKAFESLLERYEPLIQSSIRQFINPASSAFDAEDLRQEAVLCFLRAVERFDAKEGASTLGAFAKHCIRNGLVSYWRAHGKGEQTVSLEDAMSADAEDTESNPASRFIEQENYLLLCRRVCDELSAYENRIWWLFLSGRTAREIAAMLDKDEKSVQNAIYRIRRKLRSVIPNAD